MKKKSFIYKFIFCFINALILLYTLEYHHPVVDIFGLNSSIFLLPIKVKDVIISIGYFFILIFLFYILDKFIEKKKSFKQLNCSNKKLFFVVCIILLIAWSPYYLTFFPGGVYSDTFINFSQAATKIQSNDFPITYTLFIRLIYYFSFKNNTVTFAIMTIFQLFSFILVISYFIVNLKKYKVPKYILYLVILFYSLYPRIPIYALSLWKDSLFSIFLFLVVIMLFNIIYSDGEYLKSRRNIFIYILSNILCCLFRNNAYLIIVIINLILLFRYKNNIKVLKSFYVFESSFIVLVLFVNLVLFKALGYGTMYVEKIGITLNQIGYVVTNEEDIDDDSFSYINTLLPVDVIKDNYSPMIVDTLKKDYRFNNSYLEEHKKEYWKVYFELFFKYPKDYLISYSFITVGWWNYFTNCYSAGSDSLIDFNESTVAKFGYDISKNINILNKVFKIDIKDKIADMASKMNNCAIGTLIAFIGIYILISKNKGKWLLMYLPGLLIFGCLMIGTPVAYSSRYIIYTILFMPYALIIPFIKEN